VVDVKVADSRARLHTANARLLAQCELLDQRLARALATRFRDQCRDAVSRAEAALHAAVAGRAARLEAALAGAAVAVGGSSVADREGVSKAQSAAAQVHAPADGVEEALAVVSPSRLQGLLGAVGDAVLLELWVPGGATPHAGLLAARRSRVQGAVGEEVRVAFETGTAVVASAAVHLVQALFEAGGRVRA
jgi:hypothetical protein